MSGDNQNDNIGRPRRSSVTQATFSNLFQRNNSTAGTPAFPSTALNMSADAQRRRLSITTLGISGTSPTNVSALGSLRRGSLSTNSNNSDSIDENAVEDDDVAANPRTAPTTPFVRRMSFGAQAMGRIRTGSGGSPGSNGNEAPPTSSPFATIGRRSSMNAATAGVAARRQSGVLASLPQAQASNATSPRAPSDLRSMRPETGYNWSEQLRTRAESSVTGQRPSFAFPSAGMATSPTQPQDRAKSVSDMAQPPAQAPKPKVENRPKPDHFQERILKGDFYMD